MFVALDADKLRTAMEDRGLTVTRLAALADVSDETVYSALGGERRLQIRSAVAIRRALYTLPTIAKECGVSPDVASMHP